VGEGRQVNALFGGRPDRSIAQNELLFIKRWRGVIR
jgi:hypothetical protein